MTYEQYWEGDSWLVKYYRRAYELRREEINWQSWLQGMYIYEAIADISPILHPFARKGTRAKKYADKPYEFKKPERKKKAKDRDSEAKAKSDKIKGMMMAAMNRNNAEQAKKRIAEQKKQQEEAGKKLSEE